MATGIYVRHPRPAEERFWAKVQKTDGCWLWAAPLTKDGYGRFWETDSFVMSHRWAYEKLVGPVPAGLQLDHLCRVRHCVNPAHLEPVTPLENIRRGINPFSSRTHCTKGHLFDAKNTYVRRDKPGRECRQCRRERSRVWAHKGEV